MRIFGNFFRSHRPDGKPPPNTDTCLDRIQKLILENFGEKVFTHHELDRLISNNRRDIGCDPGFHAGIASSRLVTRAFIIDIDDNKKTFRVKPKAQPVKKK